MEAFQMSPNIDYIIVAVLDKWDDVLWAYARQYNIDKLKWVVKGGQSGQESICNCLNTLQKDKIDEDVTIMIHDGNRPLVTQDIISESLVTYKKYGSAITAVPCVVPVFKSDDQKSSLTHIPREKLFITQTPQTYSLKKLLWGHHEAEKKGIVNTPATSVLMNLLNEKIFFATGSEKNIKITTVDDLEIFQAILNKNEK
jgi:2-C-methyl-D-erythritol 4-phosphate cytidylyltransferase